MSEPLPPDEHFLDERSAWALISALRDRLRDGDPPEADTGVRLGEDGTLREVAPEEAWLVVSPAAPRGWAWPPHRPPPAPELSEMLDLYVPLCTGPETTRLVVAHLAQSLDGRIATASGVSQFISGAQDLRHTHRMRALFDAVVVGASTVEYDDPRLTTRLCAGDDPVRVIVDPRGRIGPTYRMVRDGPSPTLLVRREGLAVPELPDHVEVVPVASTEGQWLSVPGILEALRARGLGRIFIEGGGVTVSRFFEAGRLHRLQVSVSPTIIGSGRPAFTLPVVRDLDGARRLEARTFAMGRDVLFDCPLASGT